MPIISGGQLIEGVVGRNLNIPGAPVAGTNEVQTLTIGGTPTGGTFKLAYGGMATQPIAWSATNATLVANVNAALDLMFGTAAVVAAVGTMTAGIGTLTLTFSGAGVRRKAQPTLTTINSLTGTSPTLAVAETTPGVDATYRGASPGTTLVRDDNGLMYVNTSTTPEAPTWTVVGAQT